MPASPDMRGALVTPAVDAVDQRSLHLAVRLTRPWDVLPDAFCGVALGTGYGVV